MTDLKNNNFIKKISSLIPVILLYASVLNNFDFNYLGLKYFSFNFSYILIFYYSLKKSDSLGYGLIFIAGLSSLIFSSNMNLKNCLIDDNRRALVAAFSP